MTKYTKAELKARARRETQKAIDRQVNRLKRRFGLNRPLAKQLKPLAKDAALSVIEQECHDAAEAKVQQILEAEVDQHLDRERYERKPAAEHRGYRNGHGPERTITTRCGGVKIKPPKLRDLAEPFVSRLAVKRQRQTAEVNNFLTELYLAGLSLGDFELFLRELSGDDACLSAAHVARLKTCWEAEYRIWVKRPLRPAYAYIWADGIYLRVGTTGERLAVLVVLGVNDDGTKELLAVEPGYRENNANWQSVFAGLRDRGVKEIRLVIGDGCPGLWNAVEEYYWEAAQQLCWRHKMENILAKLPASVQDEAKAALRAIYGSTSRAQAMERIIQFSHTYHSHERAIATLLKNQERLLTFFDFPKGHWVSLRTTNPIESIFSPIRTRLNKAKWIRNLGAALALVHQQLLARESRLHRLAAHRRVASVLAGDEYRDGMPVDRRVKKAKTTRVA
jgi:putative transposase